MPPTIGAIHEALLQHGKEKSSDIVFVEIGVTPLYSIVQNGDRNSDTGDAQSPGFADFHVPTTGSPSVLEKRNDNGTLGLITCYHRLGAIVTT